MAEITFELNLPPGINSDDTTFAAQGRWADCCNVRPYNGGMQVLGSYTSVINLDPGQAITGLAVFQSGSIYTVVGTLDKLWSCNGTGAGTDITPMPAAGGVSWSFAPYGNALLCNPFQGKLYQYTVGGPASVISQAPEQIAAILVARRQVLAFGCNEEISTTFNPRCIRGSDIEDPTDWTTSTNNAFEYILDDPGVIVAARLLGDDIAVWTSTSLWLATFVGDPNQIYQFERIEGAPGAAGLEPACVLGQTAYWFAPDLQVWTWSPGAPPVPVACPISKEFTDNLTNIDALRIAAIPHYNEIWVTFTDDRDTSGDPSRYIAFNQQGQWFRGIWDRGVLCTSGMASILARGLDSHAAGAFLAANGKVIYAHELSADIPGVMAPTWYLRSADHYINDGRLRAEIQRIAPDFEQQSGDVSLTLYMRDRPQSTAVTKGPYTLTTTAAGYIVKDAVGSSQTSVNIETGSGRIAAGRKVTFGGVNEWAGGVDTGALRQFTVASDYAGGSGTLALTEAIISSGGSRNVVALPAENAVVIVLGDASKKDFRASGMIAAFKFAGSAYVRFGKPTFDAVTMGAR